MPNNTIKIPNFYHSADGYLLWIAGYTGDNQTDVVFEQVKYLNENAAKFAQMAGCPIDNVKTQMINESRRFKYM